MELLSVGWWITEVVVAILAVTIGFFLGLLFDKKKEESNDKKELEKTIKYLEREIGEVYKILCCGNIQTEDIINNDSYEDKLNSNKANEGFLYTDTPIWDSLVATGGVLKICHSHKKQFDIANYVFKEIKRIEKKQISEQYKSIDKLKEEILDMKQTLIYWMVDEITMDKIKEYVFLGIE